MRVESSSKIENVYRTLVDRIASGSPALGECLPTEFELASELGCGRHTVSQAITRLVHDGLVERRRRVGTRVTRSSVPAAKQAVKLDAFAFIYPSDRHEGIWRTVNGFQEAARRSNRRVVTLTTGADFNKDIELLSRLPEFDVKAAAIYPIIPSPRIQLQLSSLLVESSFPIVLAEVNLPGLGCPAVTVDGFHAGYTMTRYLLSKGISRIGFLANFSWSPSVAERYRGYLWAMEEAGKTVNPNNVLLDPEMRPDFDDPLKEPIMLANRYLDGLPEVEGVLCAEDFLARGLLRAAHARGLNVPNDLKVVGIDGFTTQSKEEVPLTSYHVPFEELGCKIFEVLDILRQGKSTPELETFIRGEVAVRASA